MKPGMTEKGVAPGGGMDGGRGRPFSSPPPPAVGNNKVRQLLDKLISEIMLTRLLTIISVMPTIQAAVAALHSQAKRLDRLPEGCK